MSLVVDKIKCVEESNESSSSDEIYIITFRGRTVAPFESNVSSVGPGAAWWDFDTGETANTDVTIAKTQSDAVYAVMLVEQDDGKDITGDEVLGAWRSATDLVWKSVMLGNLAGGINPQSAQAKAQGFTTISNAFTGLASIYMNFPKGNDDVLGVQRVTITAPGQTQTLQFHSGAEDCTYQVTFKHV